MKANCPGCDSLLRVPEDVGSDKIQCPKCGKRMRIRRPRPDASRQEHTALLERAGERADEPDESQWDRFVDDTVEESEHESIGSPSSQAGWWARSKTTSDISRKQRSNLRIFSSILVIGTVVFIILEGDQLLQMFFGHEVVSKAEYDRIEHGMSYRQVVSIIGQNGTELSSNKMDGIPGVMPSVTTTMYMWQNSDGSNMNAMFQNDKLVHKAQFGLK